MSVVMEDLQGGSGSKPRPRTVLLRLAACFGGLWLVWIGAVGWLVSSQILRALRLVAEKEEQAEQIARQTLDETSASAQQLALAHSGLTGVAGFFDARLSDAFSATQTFEWLVAAVLLAGVGAIAGAIVRRPWDAWPEVVWLLCAIVALLPALMAQLWLVVSIPAAVLLAVAATSHLLHRRNVTPTRGLTLARTHVTPRVQAAITQVGDAGARVGRAGSDALEQGAPSGRAALDRTGRVGRRALAAGQPFANEAIGRLKRRREPAAENTPPREQVREWPTSPDESPEPGTWDAR